MAREPVLAAGGIVLRQMDVPEIAVVRLRKRNEWVLPKGKLDDGETARDAAMREVLEETGHDVCVHEFLGTLVYESGGRSKVVHYWRMETSGEQVHELMNDIRAVDWLPLEAAVERLSRVCERAFLANVGPLALEAAAVARRARRPKVKKQPAAAKRRRPQVVAPPAALAIPVSAPPLPDLPSIVLAQDLPPVSGNDVAEVETSASSVAFELVTPPAEEICALTAAEPPSESHAATAEGPRINLVQMMRDWLRRAA